MGYGKRARCGFRGFFNMTVEMGISTSLVRLSGVIIFNWKFCWQFYLMAAETGYIKCARGGCWGSFIITMAIGISDRVLRWCLGWLFSIGKFFGCLSWRRLRCVSLNARGVIFCGFVDHYCGVGDIVRSLANMTGVIIFYLQIGWHNLFSRVFFRW